MVENMRRLEVDPVGHRGHRLQPRPLRPHHWARRPDPAARESQPAGAHPSPLLAPPAGGLPGRDPIEIPSTSRGALADAGFEVIEEQQPSFLFDRSVLVTGEVPRTTGYEPGFPLQQAWLDGALGARPPGPRRPGAHRRHQGQGAPGDHRLRPCRDRQHLPLRPTDDQGPPAVRRHGRLPSQRADLRAAHPPGPRRPGRPCSLLWSSRPTAPDGGPSTP